MSAIDRRAELACRLAELRRLAERSRRDEFDTVNAAARRCACRMLGR